MLFLAHIGITLGAAVLLCDAPSWSYSRRKLPQPCQATSTTSFSQPDCAPDCADDNLSWFNSLARQIDYRLILVGALLPDIIDKPLGTFLFPCFFNSNRIFCHTLLFLVIISSVAVYIFKRQGQTWLIALAFGTFMHLIRDGMWLIPKTLLWPAYGWAFGRTDISHWLKNVFYALLTDPYIYLPELVGAIILLGFFVYLARKGKLLLFIKKGTIQS
jgi:hypothetical protein